MLRVSRTLLPPASLSGCGFRRCKITLTVEYREDTLQGCLTWVRGLLFSVCFAILSAFVPLISFSITARSFMYFWSVVFVCEWAVIDMVSNCEGGYGISQSKEAEKHTTTTGTMTNFREILSVFYPALNLSLTQLHFIFRLNGHFIFNFIIHFLNCKADGTFESNWSTSAA